MSASLPDIEKDSYRATMHQEVDAGSYMLGERSLQVMENKQSTNGYRYTVIIDKIR